MDKNGFLRVAAAVPRVTIGDPAANVQEIGLLLQELENEGVELAVFPEMCITGYTCADLFHNSTLLDDSDKALAEAKEILSKQGATYRNLFISGGDEVKEYIGKIFGFPTTILVDKNGNIIGEPIVGSIEDEKRMDEIIKMVDDAKAGKTVSVPKSEATLDDKMTVLVTEENDIFVDHKEVWDKVFDNIQKDSAEQAGDITYAEFLKAQVEKAKDSFSEDELKILAEDIKRIDNIEKQIQELDSNKDGNK